MRTFPVLLAFVLTTAACGPSDEFIAAAKVAEDRDVATAARVEEIAATDQETKASLAVVGDRLNQVALSQDVSASEIKAIVELVVVPKCLEKKPSPERTVAFAAPVPTSFQVSIPSEKIGEIVKGAFSDTFYTFADRVDELVSASMSVAVDPFMPEGKKVNDFLGDGEESWRQALVEVTRVALSNPTTLRTVYVIAKPALIADIKDAEKAELVKSINTALPILAMPVPPELERAIMYETHVYDLAEAIGDDDTCYDVLREYPLEQARQVVQNLIPESGPLSEVIVNNGRNDAGQALYFGIRRIHEGGQPLVAAWIEILTDLKATIEAVQPVSETLADLATCERVLARDTFASSGGKWGAVCGGHVYKVGTSVQTDGVWSHTDLTLLKGVEVPARK